MKLENLMYYVQRKIFATTYNWIDTNQFVIRDVTQLRNSLNAIGKKIVLGVASIWSEKKRAFFFL